MRDTGKIDNEISEAVTIGMQLQGRDSHDYRTTPEIIKTIWGKIPTIALQKKQTADTLALICGCQNYGVMHFIHYEALDV